MPVGPSFIPPNHLTRGLVAPYLGPMTTTTAQEGTMTENTQTITAAEATEGQTLLVVAHSRYGWSSHVHQVGGARITKVEPYSLHGVEYVRITTDAKSVFTVLPDRPIRVAADQAQDDAARRVEAVVAQHGLYVGSAAIMAVGFLDQEVPDRITTDSYERGYVRGQQRAARTLLASLLGVSPDEAEAYARSIAGRHVTAHIAPM